MRKEIAIPGRVTAQPKAEGWTTVFRWHPKFHGAGAQGCWGGAGGHQGGGGEGNKREAADIREAGGQAKPTLCQTRESCRAFPAEAWLVVPATMELSSLGLQGPLFKG